LLTGLVYHGIRRLDRLVVDDQQPGQTVDEAATNDPPDRGRSHRGTDRRPNK
jgi:hypothetical protein